MSRLLFSRYLVWVVCLALSLGVQPLQLSRVVAMTCAPSSSPAQQAQSQSNSEETHNHIFPEYEEGVSLRARRRGIGPTRGWLVLREALNAHPLTPRGLSIEDPRRILVPRRTPPEADHQGA